MGKLGWSLLFGLIGFAAFIIIMIYKPLGAATDYVTTPINGFSTAITDTIQGILTNNLTLGTSIGGTLTGGLLTKWVTGKIQKGKDALTLEKERELNWNNIALNNENITLKDQIKNAPNLESLQAKVTETENKLIESNTTITDLRNENAKLLTAKTEAERLFKNKYYPEPKPETKK